MASEFASRDIGLKWQDHFFFYQCGPEVNPASKKWVQDTFFEFIWEENKEKAISNETGHPIYYVVAYKM